MVRVSGRMTLVEDGDRDGRFRKKSLDQILADQERNVGVLRQSGFGTAEHGCSGSVEGGILRRDRREDGRIENGAGLEGDPDMKREAVGRRVEGIEASL